MRLEYYIETCVFAFIMSLLAGLLVLGLTGCMSDSGWRVNFGVAPVKAIDDRAQLTQETKKKAIRQVAQYDD